MSLPSPSNIAFISTILLIFEGSRVFYLDILSCVLRASISPESASSSGLDDMSSSLLSDDSATGLTVFSLTLSMMTVLPVSSLCGVLVSVAVSVPDCMAKYRLLAG